MNLFSLFFLLGPSGAWGFLFSFGVIMSKLIVFFVEWLERKGLRLSYGEFGRAYLLLRGEWRGKISASLVGFRRIEALPLNLRWVVCQKGGGYHPSKIGTEVPSDVFARKVVVTGVVSLINLWEHEEQGMPLPLCDYSLESLKE